MARFITLTVLAAAVVIHPCNGVPITEVDPDINCLNGLLDAMIMCFVSRDLSLTHVSGVEMMDPQLLFTSLVLTPMDPLVQCGKTESYFNAMKCMLANLEFCMDPPFLVDSLPDINRMKQGMNAICTRKTQMDANCMKNHYDSTLVCNQVTMQEVLQANPARYQGISAVELICLSSDVNYDCFKDIIGANCDLMTTSTYLEQLDKYMVARVCMNETLRPGRPGRESYVKSSASPADAESPSGASVPKAAVVIIFSLALAAVLCWLAECLESHE